MAESWWFLTNHLEVLAAVDRDRDVRLRDSRSRSGSPSALLVPT